MECLDFWAFPSEIPCKCRLYTTGYLSGSVWGVDGITCLRSQWSLRLEIQAHQSGKLALPMRVMVRDVTQFIDTYNCAISPISYRICWFLGRLLLVLERTRLLRKKNCCFRTPSLLVEQIGPR